MSQLMLFLCTATRQHTPRFKLLRVICKGDGQVDWYIFHQSCSFNNGSTAVVMTMTMMMSRSLPLSSIVNCQYPLPTISPWQTPNSTLVQLLCREAGRPGSIEGLGTCHSCVVRRPSKEPGEEGRGCQSSHGESMCLPC